MFFLLLQFIKRIKASEWDTKQRREREYGEILERGGAGEQEGGSEEGIEFSHSSICKPSTFSPVLCACVPFQNTTFFAHIIKMSKSFGTYTIDCFSIYDVGRWRCCIYFRCFKLMHLLFLGILLSIFFLKRDIHNPSNVGAHDSFVREESLFTCISDTLYLFMP